MLLALLLACGEDPLPELGELSRAGWRTQRVPADAEERAGTAAVAGLEHVACWRLERGGSAAARVCSYDFADGPAAMAWDGGPRHRAGSAVYGLVHDDRALLVRSPDGEVALAVRDVLLAWDEPAWWEIRGMIAVDGAP